MLQRVALTIAPRKARTKTLPAFLQQFFPALSELPYFFGQPAYFDLLSDIVHSAAFQRLRDIRFLGAIDYLTYPNGSFEGKRHTRWDHSLGVARLAREFSRVCALKEADEKHLVVAALLHDVGHGPLSHSLEPVFKKQFGMSHHVATELIIQGRVPMGSVFPSLFKKHGIDPKEIVALIHGISNAPHVEAFSNPINIDTIEGISRAHTYISPENIPPPPSRILHAMLERRASDEAVLDGFWRLKNTVYSQLINSRTGVIADYVCRAYMRQHVSEFWSGNYFITETMLRKKHPGIFSLLRQLRASPTQVPGRGKETIEHEKRSFYIDTSVSIANKGIDRLHKRYRQEKTPAHLRVEIALEPAVSHASSPSRDTRLKLFS